MAAEGKNVPLEKQVDLNTWEIKLLQSRYESEQRGRMETGKRVDKALRDLEKLEEEMRDHRKMLMNTGTGLMFRVPKLEYWRESRKENLSLMLSVAALLITLIALGMQIFGK